MTLTIFKNDEFKTIGFNVTQKVYDGKTREVRVYSYGIQNGWSKDVAPTAKHLEDIKLIMMTEKRINDLKDFQWMFFTIAKENDWYDNQPVKMKTIDDEVKLEQERIENALQRLG